jgi:uncharacterized delta-60 repeat protein
MAIAITMAVVLVGCGGGGDGGDPSFPSAGGGPGPNSGIGASGGTVNGPSGAQVVVPSGALTTATSIAVAQSSSGAPALPAGITGVGQIFAFTPHGTTFAKPVTITVPFNPASVPAGATPTLYKTNANQSAWEVVTGATVTGGTMSGQVTGFSFAIVAFPSLTEKTWILGAFDVEADEKPEPLEKVTQVGGEVRRQLRIGEPLILAPPSQATPEAVVQVFSNESGKTFYSGAQAPRPAIGDSINTGTSDLIQTFTFKRPKGAVPSLKFVLSSAFLETFDGGGAAPSLALCPWLDPTLSDQEIHDACVNHMMETQIEFRLRATRLLATDSFYSIASRANLTGAGQEWSLDVEALPDFTAALWSEGDFDVDKDVDGGGDGRHATATLKTPFTVVLPLEGNVGDDELFTVEIEIFSGAANRVGAESYAAAFIRDPLQDEGLTLEFSGLEQVPVQHPTLIAPTAQPCTGGIDATAGALQFTTQEFAAPERRKGGSVFVERVGGTHGEVSVLLETADGTALAGDDYETTRTVVRFADGQAGKRLVTIPFTLDKVAEPDKDVSLKLSPFTGCAALGAQSTATLIIQDDDRPLPVVPTFKVGGTVTGLSGSGLVLTTDLADRVTPAGNGPFTFHNALKTGTPYTVSIVTQPTNPSQICTVSNGSGTVAAADITNIAVSCATPQPNGALDATFGSQGKVFNTISSATAIALQADGKLLVLGSRTLSRYNSDGSLDTAFGSGGKADIVMKGGGLDAMIALAVQADGKIVVAGFSSLPTEFNDDFALQRFNPDGTLDTAFGSGGKVFTDFDGINDQAKALLIQGDGKIIAAGQAQVGSLTNANQDFAVVRYLSDGTLDPNFGTGGKMTVDFGDHSDFADAAALQADGSIVVVGRVFTDGGSGDADIGITRVLASGGVDGGFGSTGGIERIDFAQGGIVPATFAGGGFDEATDVVIQPDGKILIGGYTLNLGVFKAALVRLNSSNGSLDGTFGSAGLFTSSATETANGIALQADGKIVFTGSSSGDFGVVRVTDAGAVDTSFGTNGVVHADFFGASDVPNDVLVQPDGKIVAAGKARNGSSGGLGMVRVTP